MLSLSKHEGYRTRLNEKTLVERNGRPAAHLIGPAGDTSALGESAQRHGNMIFVVQDTGLQNQARHFRFFNGLVRETRGQLMPHNLYEQERIYDAWRKDHPMPPPQPAAAADSGPSAQH